MNTTSNRIPARLALAVALAGSAFLCASPRAAAAPHAEVQEVMTRALPDYPGKEGLMITVTYPPGSVDAEHRHDAHAFVYVLEGEVVMQVRGGPAQTLKAGQSFYEGPQDVHVVGRNASATKPAKFVVFMLKNKGAPVLTPVT